MPDKLKASVTRFGEFSLLGSFLIHYRSSANICTTLFPGYVQVGYILISTKKRSGNILWQFFSQTHLVALLKAALTVSALSRAYGSSKEKSSN
jgi:hypothetical protein